MRELVLAGSGFLTGSILSLVIPLGLLPIVLAWWWLSLRRRSR